MLGTESDHANFSMMKRRSTAVISFQSCGMEFAMKITQVTIESIQRFTIYNRDHKETIVPLFFVWSWNLIIYLAISSRQFQFNHL